MKKILNFLLLFFAVFVVACAAPVKKFPGQTETERLNNFFEYSFNIFVERSPMTMTYLGIPKRQGELDDISEKATLENIKITKEHLKILKSFDFDKLTPQAKVSYKLYKKQSEDQMNDLKWKDYGYPVNQMFGIHSQLPSMMMNLHQVKNEQDLKNYISRLGQFKRVMGQVITQMMRSETKGIVPPKFVYPKVLLDSKNLIKGKPFDKSKMDAPLYSDFKRKLKTLKLSKAKQTEYTKLAEAALKESVKPAYQDIITFMTSQEKRATKQHGVWKFPKGNEFYKNQIQRRTTTDYSPDKIHQIGLDNVARIHAEMNEIRKKVGFKGDLNAFFKHMQKSKKFYYPANKNGRKAYMKLATGFIDTMRTRLDKLFITKPKAAIRVKAVEAFREKSAGLAFYEGATVDGSRPGTYYVNLVNVKALPKWEAEALAYHEGIPGHHMQISIAQEMKSLPKFRRHGGVTAYQEGWGLYSERIPKEIGFYKDPYSDFGRLSMELLRACRLVVDTGIHWKKWTRDEAVSYLDKNTPGDHNSNVRSINRYIVMPGQATAYMIGMLKILELREKAKKTLGKKFDIRKFHEVVLINGAVPMDILESLVDSYISKAQKI